MLTESGAYLLVALQRGFEGINDAFEQLRAQHGRSSVTIRSSTAVSSLWLTPRLAHFWKSYEHISVAQIVSDTEQAVGDCDLSLHYADMSRDNGHCRAFSGPDHGTVQPAICFPAPQALLRFR